MEYQNSNSGGQPMADKPATTLHREHIREAALAHDCFLPSFCVQERAGPAPKGMKRPATQWVKPGLVGRVKHLRGEEDLRHASLQDFREDGT